jgi:uncharacterized protein (TIGR02145 family)
MNYSKISGQPVCKMAMLLAFMFAACSETDSVNNFAGGTVEETGVYALVGQVGDIYPKLLQIVDSTESGNGEFQTVGNSVYANKGTVVTVYELDSLTLEKTGRFFADTVDNDSGYFAFDQLALSSPYVLIETLDSCYTKHCDERGLQYYYANVVQDSSVKYLNEQIAIVDLRKMKELSVNSLTTEKISLVQQYFSEGMSFAAASKKAEEDILESLGVYENLGSFESLNADESELPYIVVLKQQSLYFKEFPRFDRFLFDWKGNFVYAPQSSFAAFGNEIEQSYLNTIKMYNYLVEFIAHDANLGKCDESREDETSFLKIGSRFELPLVCRSGKWQDGFKKMDYTKGEMVDSRDGQKYKTVTYNFGKVSQTWMAENLNFKDAEPSKCWKYDPDCQYGRLYDWGVAMDVDNGAARLIGLDTRSNDTVYNKSLAEWEKEFFEIEHCWYENSGCYYDKLYEVRTGDENEPVKLVTGEDSKNFLSIDGFCASVAAGYPSYNMSVQNEQGNSRSAIGYCDAKYPESAYAFYLDYMKPELKTESASYQGVCPDGWRIPNVQDWSTLIENIADVYGIRDEIKSNDYGVQSDNLGSILNDDYAAGFGYTAAFGVDVGDTGRRQVVSLEYTGGYAALPSLLSDDSNETLLQTYFDFRITKQQGIEAKLQKVDNAYSLQVPVFVRCIKN